AFAAEGRKIGVEVTNNVDAKHWKRLRDAFLRCITERDFIGCLIVQEIMLESFAVASYSRVGKVGPGSLGGTFARIAAEEEDHVDHAMAILRTERARDAQRFDDKVRSEEHTSELQSRFDLVCRLLLEKKKKKIKRSRD